jgi:hypothetical protein
MTVGKENIEVITIKVTTLRVCRLAVWAVSYELGPPVRGPQRPLESGGHVTTGVPRS